MSSTVEITLPNGLKYEQPTGLFIDNTFVTGSGDKFSVINPAYVMVTLVSLNMSEINMHGQERSGNHRTAGRLGGGRQHRRLRCP